MCSLQSGAKYSPMGVSKTLTDRDWGYIMTCFVSHLTTYHSLSSSRSARSLDRQSTLRCSVFVCFPAQLVYVSNMPFPTEKQTRHSTHASVHRIYHNHSADELVLTNRKLTLVNCPSVRPSPRPNSLRTISIMYRHNLHRIVSRNISQTEKSTIAVKASVQNH